MTIKDQKKGLKTLFVFYRNSSNLQYLSSKSLTVIKLGLRPKQSHLKMMGVLTFYYVTLKQTFHDTWLRKSHGKLLK